MAYDPTLPATGVTTFGNLYAALRANFVGLYDMITPQPDWTSFSVNANWSGTNCAYMKDLAGFVHLQGNAVNTGNYSGSETAYTLLAGYRPVVDLYLPNAVGKFTSSGHWRVYGLWIKTDGTIRGETPMTTDDPNVAVFYFDGIIFQAVVV